MLRQRHRAPLLVGLLASAVSVAHAANRETGASIRRPEQLTVGASDQFLGQLAPDGKQFYFLSNRNTLNEIFYQKMDSARSLLLFDEGADINWVRVSPDGLKVLFISFRDAAAGQLCVRDLQGEARRCLDEGSHAVQAVWMGPAEIALVSRDSLQGDLRLSRVTVGKRLAARPFLSRNLTSPAISPNRRWLVYVPVERYAKRVGSGFAAKAAARLEAVRLGLDGQPGAPVPLPLSLPGLSAQPAFAADGKSLYVAQFLNDTNHDGVIDGSDHAVLFRVPFEGDRDDAPARAARAFPVQLTDSSWNCQYPSPAATELLITCTRGRNLDIYSLPLSGVVPEAWDEARLREEIGLSARRIDLLLLHRHLLAHEKDATQRHLEMTILIALHLQMDEFDAAEFYAHELEGESDAATAGLAEVLKAQIDHRRALRMRERGQGGASFREAARARLQALAPEAEQDGRPASPAAQALRRIVRSEIADSLGDREAARRELEGARVDEVAVPVVLQAYADRAEALYRLLDDESALWRAGKELAAHPLLSPEERLHHARAAARTLVRGKPLAEAEAALSREQAAAAPDSELAFALALERTVLRIRDDRPGADVRDAVVALYRGQTRPDRRHAVVMEAGQRATDVDAVSIVETLAQLYLDDVPRGTAERRRAERLYQRVIEGRAYRRLARGRLTEARDDFAQVARATGSLESHVGYIDILLREGKGPAEIQAEYAAQGAEHSAAVTHFVGAYLTLVGLPRLDDRQHEEQDRQAIDLLRQTWHELNSQPLARILRAALLHEQFLRSGDKDAAARADTHYLVALDLLQKNPRYKAMVLEQLGLLQAQVGNHRIALAHLEERESYPFPDPASGVIHHMVKAQTLLHLDRAADAAKAADAALATCAGAPSLSAYCILVLDWTALYNLAAGHFARALQLYDQEVPLLPPTNGPAGVRNSLVVRLARAAAALGASQPRRALDDLGTVDGGLAPGDEKLRDALRWPHTSGKDTLLAYRVIATGLRARAHRALRELPAAARALERQEALLEERFEHTRVDEQLQPLALAEAELAELAQEVHDAAGAGRWLQRALEHADAFVRRTKIPVSAEQVNLLWLAAELKLSAGTRPALDLPGRLRAMEERILAGGDPNLRGYARLLEVYFALASP